MTVSERLKFYLFPIATSVYAPGRFPWSRNDSSLIKERFFIEDIMLGPIKIYEKTKKLLNNSKLLTQISENDNEISIFMELHHNQLVPMILFDMIWK